MIKKYLLLAALGFLVSCNSDTTTSVKDEPDKFTKKIERVASNEFEMNLIYKAESIYPPRDSVIAHIYLLSHSIPDTNLWFYSDFEDILIPYAITSEAISFYDNLIDLISEKNGNNYYYTANFEYRAEIEFNESYTFEGNDPISGEPLPSVSFERVYVVNMILKWKHYCGVVCGLWLTHNRIVVFDESGNLLNVFYDGPILVAVS